MKLTPINVRYTQNFTAGKKQFFKKTQPAHAYKREPKPVISNGIGFLNGFKDRILANKNNISASENILEQFKNDQIYLNMKLAVDKEQMEEYLNSNSEGVDGVKYINPSKVNPSNIDFAADKVLVEDTPAIYKGRNVENLVKALGTPMVIRGLKVHSFDFDREKNPPEYIACTHTADNITVFDMDENNNITGATVYKNVKLQDTVFSVGEIDKTDMPPFARLSADEVYKIKDGKPVSYMKDYTSTMRDVMYDKDDRETNAKIAIEFMPNGVADVYKNYHQTGDNIPFGSSEELIDMSGEEDENIAR